ncbi:hypothetical protein FBU30_007487 [Linnemannia zychae]|nr:hypothetical protein FBU30_007487 [Linnemannia zychae]
MGRTTRSSAKTTLSGDAVACDSNLASSSVVSMPAPPSTKRSSRRLTNNNHAIPNKSPSSVSTLEEPTTSKAVTRTRGRSNMKQVIQKVTEDNVLDECNSNDKENSPPSSLKTRTTHKDNHASKQEIAVLSENVAIVNSEETLESISLSDTKFDSITATVSPTKTPIATSNENNTIKVTEKDEQDIQQQQLLDSDHSNIPPIIRKKRKWSRGTKIVKPVENLPAEQAVKNEMEDKEDQEEEEVEEVQTSSDSDDSDGEYGKSRKRSKPEVSAPRFKIPAETQLTDYEKQRLENIRRNQEMLLSLELPTVVAQLQIATLEGKPLPQDSSKDDVTKNTPAPVRISRQREWKAAPKVVKPVRISNRLRGIAVTPVMIGENDQLENGSGAKTQRHNNSEGSESNETGDNSQGNTGDDEEEDMGNLMSGDLFFDKATRERAIRVDGHYHGWLDPGVIERYGFEKNAKEAWEANGGGSFSFKDPLGAQGEGSGASRSKNSKRPKHEAKMVAKSLFKKNPNAFFYRHNEPGQEQWTGDWTAEEQEIFLRVAAEHGCGDKWGLFASHIPHRVGYQCSNFYRQVVLPEGLVFDPNYEYTSRGKPIYCGKYNQWRK